VHGCVVYDADTEMIVGVLLDGSDINVVYGQPKWQNSPPHIVYDSEVCPKEKAPESTPLSNEGRKYDYSMDWFVHTLHCLSLWLYNETGLNNMLALFRPP
jgi:hypothetical protein